MDGTVVVYLVYLLASGLLTMWVAATLARCGRVVLIDVFQGNVILANSVNRLLQTGFYLVSFGFVALWLRLGESVDSTREGLEALGVKLGTVSLVLGAIHLLNLYVFNRLRRKSQPKDDPLPQPDSAAWTPLRSSPVDQ